MIKLRDLLNEIINEALPISKAKELYSIQKSDKIMDEQNIMFETLKTLPEYIKSNNNGDRLYFNINEDIKTNYNKHINADTTIQDKITTFLKSEGYKVTDYIKGIATDKYNREVKIGKVLNKSKSNLLQKFNNDVSRQSLSTNQIVVFSKNPYDIGGMSSNRGWTSCMNLYGDNENKHYVNCDIKKGTIIAYLINVNDTNINKPQARILIKSFINVKDKNDIVYWVGNDVYGTAPEYFYRFVNSVFEKFYPHQGKYKLSAGLYDDEGTPGNIDFKEEEKRKKQIEIANKIANGEKLEPDEYNLDYLMLYDRNIKSIPPVKVKGTVSLVSNYLLKSLPDGFEAKGNLWLSSTGIETLPQSLSPQQISLNKTPLAKKFNDDVKLIRKAYPNLKGKIFV
jgi:hypothetical protein